MNWECPLSLTLRGDNQQYFLDEWVTPFDLARLLCSRTTRDHRNSFRTRWGLRSTLCEYELHSHDCRIFIISLISHWETPHPPSQNYTDASAIWCSSRTSSRRWLLVPAGVRAFQPDREVRMVTHSLSYTALCPDCIA